MHLLGWDRVSEYFYYRITGTTTPNPGIELGKLAGWQARHADKRNSMNTIATIILNKNNRGIYFHIILPGNTR